jgi:hypothetical protein
MQYALVQEELSELGTPPQAVDAVCDMIDHRWSYDNVNRNGSGTAETNRCFDGL